MNRYPLWKYLTVLAALVIGVIYTLPNLFGESPAVQVASAKSTVKIDLATMSRVEDILKRNNITSTGSFLNKTDLQALFEFVLNLLMSNYVPKTSLSANWSQTLTMPTTPLP